MRDYYQVPVAEVIRETGDASSLALDVPPALAGTFAYRPGQFVTVRVPSDQTGSVARCYSLCSSPQAGDLPAITVKRTAGGYASNWILDNVTAGTVLDLLPPAGTFCPRSLDGDFLLFAAGSGITPIISILKSVLAAGRGRVALVYANRDEQSVIFAERAAQDRGRGGRPAGLSCTGSTRCRGLRPPPGSRRWPSRTPPGSRTSAGPTRTSRWSGRRWRSWACRPSGSGRSGSCRWRRTRSRRHRPTGGVAATLTVDLDGATRVLPWPPGARMLDVLIAAGLTAPYSCRQGICGACACQLTGGEVEMAHNEVLEAADLADGYILACQAVPLTPDVSITY